MLHVRLLDRKDDSGRNLWELTEPYKYAIGINTPVTVPAGYITNFGTIPRLAYWIIAPSEMREASVVHDFLCNENFKLDGEPTYSGFDRRVADAILFVHLRQIGIGYVKAYLIYLAVRFYAIFTRLAR